MLRACLALAIACGPTSSSAPFAAPITAAVTPVVDPAPALPPTHDCEQHYYHQVARADGPALHVVGVYEASGWTGVPETDPPGEIGIEVVGPSASVLVLSAYNPTRWRIRTRDAAVIERVILNGYHRQSAVIEGGVAVVEHSADLKVQGGADQLAPTSYKWPHANGAVLVAAAEGLAGRAMSSYRGCYDASFFTIASEPVTESAPWKSSPVVAGCDKLASENACVLTARVNGANRLAMLGLESGEVCFGPVIGGVAVSDIHALGWSGDSAYVCERGRGVARISLADGNAQIAPFDCESVTTGDNGELYVYPKEGAILRFADFESVAPGKGTRITRVRGSRIAVAGSRLYSAWHATMTIDVNDAATGSKASDLVLSNFDDWVHGMSAVGNKRLAIATRDGRVIAFDSRIGLRKRDYALGAGVEIRGLDCNVAAAK